MTNRERVLKALERARALKLTHQHFQTRKGPKLAATVSLEKRAA